MKIAILGAGAVGCYYGGLLARAGHEVVLIGRGPNMAAIARDGLKLDTQEFQCQLPIAASVDTGAMRGAALTLCCVKATDTAAVALQMAPWLTPQSLVLSLQNGVDNAQRLQAQLPCPVAPAVVYVAVEMAGPGHVRHHGRGDLIIGPAPAGPLLQELFTGAGVPVRISPNVTGALWSKLIINCAYNALSAIVQQPYGQLVQGEGVWGVMMAVMEEGLAVARASGVSVPEGMWDALQGIARDIPRQYSSTAQDLARGRPGEIDFLNGYVVRAGAALGIATPVNQVLYSLVKILETRGSAIAS